jgi:uncharacterized membrane protein YgcG
MECPGCKSSNVERLAHYWQSLPAESPLRAKYAPPDAVEARYWVALLSVVVGIVFTASGAVWAGLLVAVGGMAFGAINHQQVKESQATLAEWKAAMICLACPGTF